jgi:hypothetical protein
VSKCLLTLRLLEKLALSLLDVALYNFKASFSSRLKVRRHLDTIVLTVISFDLIVERCLHSISANVDLVAQEAN